MISHRVDGQERGVQCQAIDLRSNCLFKAADHELVQEIEALTHVSLQK